ncbi:MAG: CvpA family protein [Eubacteriales bacterium]|nr:CvpA family protein [Eubacteriales bacterium]
MNVLVIILVLFALWRAVGGFKKGMVDEVRLLLSLLIALFVLSLGILLYTSVREKDTRNIILSVIMLLVTGLAARLVDLIFKSLSAIAHLPVIGLLNKLLGAAVGALEAVVALWIIYILIGAFDTGLFGSQIAVWTMENEFLTKLYRMNSFAYWLAGL